ncbi:winged helix-turn-helix domain-containing protein [Halobacteriaceae archaeon SHR40]|uniref:ArsR/SmtB family transcription factor n=1 Tax=Halovenus amylolytica TaxID=2500550 RepID=UPI000FE42BDD
MSLLPSSYDSAESEEAEPRVVDVESEEADEVFDALASETARRLLTQLHESPAPPAQLADSVDTSVQNAQYHLAKLEDAGAIEVVDTAYSEKGREMDVYAPADQALVIFAGDEEEGSTLRTAISRLLGSLGIVALASAVVQALYSQQLFPFGGGGPAGDSDSAGDSGADGQPAGDGSDDGLDGGAVEESDTADDGAVEETDTGEGGAIETEDVDTETAMDNATDAQDGMDTADADVNISDGVTNATDAVTDGQLTPEEPQTAVETAANLPPGLLFFVGGVFALCLVFAVFYYTEIR